MSVFVSRGLPDITFGIVNGRVHLDQGKHGIAFLGSFEQMHDEIRPVLLRAHAGREPRTGRYAATTLPGGIVRLEAKKLQKRAWMTREHNPSTGDGPAVILVRADDIPAFLTQLASFLGNPYTGSVS
ncbi:hypothetical protein [Arthrobacter sp. zg-Y1110]|uniref:hypothetical protein n=1 Tax=Arthrobacter sp. zg-Y1110 TaxID=2886932 RepID=UPI001D14D1A9|nr:hypothetical protein [Arthrobacter sp. zg-Y1110]MCC3292901.1 hypothetical protein [Arthrobacter sp. zg-Y1110]UWX86840.1 hypothetical protein N2K99_18530 [Arthrobacter sp. zg-Y1110]